jgi:hypothetical protein
LISTHLATSRLLGQLERAFSISATPKVWRGRSAINDGSGGSRPTCATISGSPVTRGIAHVRPKRPELSPRRSRTFRSVAADLRGGLLHLGDYRRSEDLCRKVAQSLACDLSHKRFRLTEFPPRDPRYYLTLALAERGEFDEGSPTDGRRSTSPRRQTTSSAWFWCWGAAYLYGLGEELSHGSPARTRGSGPVVELHRPVTAADGIWAQRTRAWGVC